MFVSSGVRRRHFLGFAFITLSVIYSLRPAHRSLIFRWSTLSWHRKQLHCIKASSRSCKTCCVTSNWVKSLLISRRLSQLPSELYSAKQSQCLGVGFIIPRHCWSTCARSDSPRHRCIQEWREHAGCVPLSVSPASVACCRHRARVQWSHCLSYRGLAIQVQASATVLLCPQTMACKEQHRSCKVID